MSSGRAAARSTSERARAAPAAYPELRRVAEVQRDTDPAAFEIYCDLFAPELRRNPSAYKDRIYGFGWLKRAGVFGWLKAPADASVADLLGGHIMAGATGEAVDVGRPLLAVGLQATADEITGVLNVDVDRDAAFVVPRWRDLLGPSALVVPGSGKPGRVRLVARLARPVTVAEAQQLGLALARHLEQPKPEVYPGTTNGRLPGGAVLRGDGDDEQATGPWCLHEPVQLVPGPRLHPLAFARLVHELPGVDLLDLVKRTGARVAVVEVRGTKAKATRTASRSPTPPPTVDAAQVRSWKRDGVAGYGERDAALTALVLDCYRRRMAQAAAVAYLEAWIDRGCIARARDNDLESNKADVRRRIAAVYGFGPARYPKPVHLTVAEVLEVERIAEQAARWSGQTAASVAEFLFRILPLFKGAALAGHTSEPELRVHRDKWLAAGGSRYRQRRDAYPGLFVATGGYVQKRLDPKNAKARPWVTTFPFDLSTPAPRRPLGSTYARALLASHLSQPVAKGKHP